MSRFPELEFRGDRVCASATGAGLGGYLIGHARLQADYIAYWAAAFPMGFAGISAAEARLAGACALPCSIDLLTEDDWVDHAKSFSSGEEPRRSVLAAKMIDPRTRASVFYQPRSRPSNEGGQGGGGWEPPDSLHVRVRMQGDALRSLQEWFLDVSSNIRPVPFATFSLSNDAFCRDESTGATWDRFLAYKDPMLIDAVRFDLAPRRILPMRLWGDLW